MRTPRLAFLGLLAASSLSLAAPASASATGSASPDAVGNDGSKTIVVTASGFLPASQEAVVLRPAGGGTDLTATVSNKSACSGVTIPGLANADCGNQLSVVVNTLNALPGSYDVVETQTDQSSLPSTTTTRTLATVTVFSQPTFAPSNPLAPASLGQGARSALVTVTGTGFADGITADFGAGTTATDVRVQSPTSLTVSVAVTEAASPGPRDVTLTSAEGKTAKATSAFTISPGPVITQITPAKVLRGASASVTVTGSHFVAGNGFALTINGTSITNTVVNAAGNQITADVATVGTTPYGPRAVRVRNADAGEFVLDNAFTVTAPPGAPSGVSVAPGDTMAYVSWSPPVDPGSSSVTGYTVTVSDSTVLAKTVTGTSATFTGLTNGTPYTFTVTPKNDDAGDGTPATATGTPAYATRLALSVRQLAVATQDLVVSGVVTRTGDGSPVASGPVTLTFAPRVGPSFTRGAQTDSSGRFRYTLKATYTTTLRAAFTGRVADAPATSTVTTFVAPRVSVVSPRSSTTSAARQTITVVGSVSPNKHGKVVGLYFGSRRVGQATIASNSSFRIPVKLARGNYRLVVRIAPTPGNIAGESPAFILRRR